MYPRLTKKLITATLTASTVFLSCLLFACGGHKHALNLVPEKEATCSGAGNTAYYECACGKYFSDENCENEITAEQTRVPAKSHILTGHGFDSENHYLKCAVCGYEDKTAQATHILKFAADDSVHYRYCSICGYETEHEAHLPDNEGEGFCSVCRFRRPKYELSADGTYYICSGASQAFKDSVTEIIIPDEYEGLPVKEVGERAFDGCKELVKITFGKNVVTIGDFALKSCVKLTEVNFNEGLKEIKYSAFYGCKAIEKFVLPDGLKTLGNSVFRDCSSLKEINIPPQITVIGSQMFYACTALESFEVPAHVTSIEMAAFCESGLVNFTVRDGLKAIPQTMFNKCPKLKTVKIPASVTSIGPGAFMDCSALETVYYAGTYADWEKITFGFVWNNKSYFDLVCSDRTVRYEDGALKA